MGFPIVVFCSAKERSFRRKRRQTICELQRRFVEAMPFIPLWQLDRHMVVSTKLKISFDDAADSANPKWLSPDEPFAGVARWKLLD